MRVEAGAAVGSDWTADKDCRARWRRGRGRGRGYVLSSVWCMATGFGVWCRTGSRLPACVLSRGDGCGLGGVMARVRMSWSDRLLPRGGLVLLIFLFEAVVAVRVWS